MVTITFTKQERKALRKGSTLLFVSMPPPWDTGSMGGVRVPTYRNRVVIFLFDLKKTTIKISMDKRDDSLNVQDQH